jgi:hypothetical protein
MRFWFSGPRLFSGLVRPGVSFGPADWRARRIPAAHLELARKAVRQLAKDHGVEVPPDAAIDAWLEAEVARRRRRWSALSIAWFIFKMIIAVPIAAFTIGGFWIAVLLLQQMH